MSWTDLETQIEDELEALLNVGGSNQIFQINRFYSTVNEADLIDYIQSKVKQVPSVFLRVTGDLAEQLDTLGQVHSSVFSVEIIIAANNYGKLKQIKGEPRKVNLVKAAVLGRLAGQSLSIAGQPTSYLVYQGSSDLFTSDTLDVRQINMQVQGLVQDFSETGLNEMLEGLMNG